MNKGDLSESDICDKFIRPAMEQAGWNGLDQIYREYPLRAGRVVVRGKKAQRDKSTILRADYALFYKANIPLAVVEAKDNKHAMGSGMVNPQLGEVVLDPATGTGGFLVCAIEHLRKQVNNADQEAVLQNSIRGVEKKQMPHMLCVTNLLLHGIEVPSNIRHDNTLVRPLRDYTQADRVDVVLTNPPFGGVEEPGIEQGYPADVRTKETADLFLVLIKHILKTNGRAALVLPDGTLFGEGVKSRIKEQLLAECNLHTIVRLPNGVFAPYTGIRTNLLFFTKGQPTQHVWYYEHPYPLGVKSYNKTKPIRIEEFDAEKAWWGTEADGFASRTENERAWKVSIEQIKATNWNLDQKNPHVGEQTSHDPEVLLADYARLQSEAQALRDELKGILAQSLSAKTASGN